jgi:cation:H+ antiporter
LFGFKGLYKSVKKVVIALILLLVASEGIVRSAGAFSEALGISLPLVGILIVGLGNALPETYFAIISARRKNTFMILGDLMGSVIICSTLVLGIVVLIAPIQIHDFSPFAVARIFLVISALFFFIAVKSDKRITRIEGLLLLLLYISFIIVEVYLK